MRPQSDFHFKTTMWAWQGKTKQKGYYVSTNIKIEKITVLLPEKS